MSAEQGDEWTPYHEFRKRTDPPPWGQGLDAEEPPMAEQGETSGVAAEGEGVSEGLYTSNKPLAPKTCDCESGKPALIEIEGRVLVCEDCAADVEFREWAREDWR